MNYTDSSLATVHIWSPNYSSRTDSRWGNPEGKIDRITIHHMAGNATVEAVGNIFAQPSRQASATYLVGTDGRIAQCVHEKDRPWTSSSAVNDVRAITIEVANCKGDPNWEVSDAALAATIKLCADICKRNGIKKLNYTGDTTGNMTMHKWFAATGCPGPYLGSKFPYIAQEVNKLLNASTTTPTTQPKSTGTTAASLNIGDVVKIQANAPIYGTNQLFKNYIYTSTLYVRKKDDKTNRVVISTLKEGAVTGAVDAKYLTKVSSTPAASKPKTEPAKPSTPKLPGYTGLITYSAFAGGKWWADISSANADKATSDSYAGCFGWDMTAIRAKAQYGKLWMSVHTIGGSWSKKVDLSTGAYCGSNTAKIDGVKIWSETGHVDFQVHTKNGKWWSWIDSRNCNGTDYNSYAGVLGQPIDAIKMK